jgi:hypothetical protein
MQQVSMGRSRQQAFKTAIPIGIPDSFNVGSVFVKKGRTSLRSIRQSPPHSERLLWLI